MSDLKMAPRVTPTAVTSDSGWKAVEGFRDGSISVVDFKQRMAAAGRLMTATMGSVTTPLTFLATAANRPDAWVRVPAGTAIMPVYLNIALETSAGTATEIDSRVCANDSANGTSSAATVAPSSLRLGGGDTLAVASNCTARQLATADTTAETTPISIYRKTFGPISDTTTPGGADRGVDKYWDVAPLLIGAATWEVFIAATTAQATGFVIMQWIETPSNWWT